MVVAIILPILTCCTNKNQNLKETTLINYDSITFWIQQARLKKATTNQQIETLKKAYNLTSKISSDSIRSIYLNKIAIESETQNIDSLFLKVNAESIMLATKLGNYSILGEAHWNYGNYYTDIEVIDSAYFHFHKAYENFKIIKHEYFMAKMLYNMAYIQSKFKDYTGSEVLVFEAISRFEKVNKSEMLYHCYNQLGLVYYNLAEYDKAVFYHNKALDYLDKIRNKQIYKEGSLSNLGLVYQKLNNFEKAIDNFESALEQRELKNQNPYFYARIIDNIAYTKFLRGDTTNIENDFFKSLKIRDSLKDVSGVVIGKRHLSEYFAVKKDTLSAIKIANEAFNLADKVDNFRDKLETLLLLSNVDKTNSSKYLKEYVRLNDSLQVEDRKIRNKFTRIRFETDEYIQETQKLSQQKILISLGGLIVTLLLTFAYIVRVQRIRNKELIFEKEQQKSNEEIYSLMLKQQKKLEEGKIKERHRISEDLHDGVLGKIFGTRLGLGFLNIKGDKTSMDKLQSYIDELQSIEKEIRAISHELKNEILTSKENFFKIIEDLVEKKCNLENLEWEFNYDEKIKWKSINDNIKINFYRIIQEALQNVIKYADATKIDVAINLVDGNLELVIKDNGKGFNVNEKRKGIGLKNMKSRAIKIGGFIEVNSYKNEGTTIYVTCPIQNFYYD